MCETTWDHWENPEEGFHEISFLAPSELYKSTQVFSFSFSSTLLLKETKMGIT